MKILTISAPCSATMAI